MSARMRYRFYSAMSRGPFVVIAYLAALSVAIMVFAARLAVLFGMAFAGGNDDGPLEALWQALLRTVDAGTFAADSAWHARLLSLTVALLCTFLAGPPIGLTPTPVDPARAWPRRGRAAAVG